MVDAAKVDKIALYTNSSPSSRPHTYHAAYGNNAVPKGAKCMM